MRATAFVGDEARVVPAGVTVEAVIFETHAQPADTYD
jgi:hypothetical protein